MVVDRNWALIHSHIRSFAHSFIHSFVTHAPNLERKRAASPEIAAKATPLADEPLLWHSVRLHSSSAREASVSPSMYRRSRIRSRYKSNAGEA